MGYSESGQAGIKANGREWRKTLRGIPNYLEDIREALDAQDLEEIHSNMRKIASAFRTVFDEGKASSREVEALEWFEEETCTYEAEQGLMGEFCQEFDYRLDELYDYADYNRIWVSP